MVDQVERDARQAGRSRAASNGAVFDRRAKARSRACGVAGHAPAIGLREQRITEVDERAAPSARSEGIAPEEPVRFARPSLDPGLLREPARAYALYAPGEKSPWFRRPGRRRRARRQGKNRQARPRALRRRGENRQARPRVLRRRGKNRQARRRAFRGRRKKTSSVSATAPGPASKSGTAITAFWRRLETRRMRTRLVQGGGENGRPVRDRALAAVVDGCFPVGKERLSSRPGRG